VRILVSAIDATTVALRPAEFLGRDQFPVYLAATRSIGARFDPAGRRQVLALDRLGSAIESLSRAGFAAELAPDVAAKLNGQADRARQARADAVERRDVVETAMAKSGLALYPFQKIGVEWLAPRKTALLADEMGCVDGDAIIYVNRAGKEFEVSLRWLYAQQNGLSRKSAAWDARTPTSVLAFCVTYLGYQGIVKVLARGVRSVVCVTLMSGRTIRVTPDHEILTSGGWRRADAIGPLDTVFTSRGVARGEIVVDFVTSVKPAGETDVYDIVCEDPHRNFVASGFIVHNCGKTVQALISIPASAPILVIGPVVAKGVWCREVAKWRPDIKRLTVIGNFSKRLAKLHGIDVLPRDRFRFPIAGEIVAVNYDVLPDQLPPCLPGVRLVIDEMHACKNRKTARTRRTRAVINAVLAAGGTAWGLTGSPLLNQPFELWTLLESLGLAKEAFGSWPRFIRLFNGRQDRWGGWTWGRVEPEAVEGMRRVMLRRLQEDVLPDLPALRYDDLEGCPIDAATRKLCDEVEAWLDQHGISLEAAVAAVQRGDHADIPFEMFSALRAALATAKIPTLMDLVDEYEEQEEPLVVFSSHRAPIDALGARAGWATITGDTPAATRSEIEERFQAGALRGVAATIRAGGVAITLTRAHHMIFVDQDWTPELNKQATYRCKRIGQTKPVIVRRLIADHRMDERVLAILDEKTDLVDASVNAAAIQHGAVEVRSAAELALDHVQVQPARAPATPARKPVRAPASPREFWAARALEILTGCDSDHAELENFIGWNRLDNDIGHSLTDQLRARGGLTDAQWGLALRILPKYHGQVGTPPAQEEVA